MALEPPPKRPVGAANKRFPRRFGRYILEKTLSRGGMGEVLLAVVRGLDQRCVIKTIRGDLTGDEEFVGRFADEAKILVRAAHENIIRYFDAGRVASDYYIAMEFVHGRDLGDVLDRAYERGEPMPPEIGLFITANLLEGLHYAHELEDEHGRRMGLVHRDISPQNVLVGFDGSVKLIDFGLARTDLLPNRTQGALAVGKYGYMSPEQARHEPLDGRADVYSAGVMLFEVFTGDRLVDEQEQATLWQRVLNPKHRRPRAVLPSLPREIDDLVMKAVAVDPRDRFGDAHAMAEAANALRGPSSNRNALKAYLRRLYPHVDFSPPPLPSLDDLVGGVEESFIFATSREGARSVFGRGELPIEGTMQIDAREVRAEIQRRRGLEPESGRESAPSPTAPSKKEPRRAKPKTSSSGPTGGSPPERGVRSSRRVRPMQTSAEQPTLVAPRPVREEGSAADPRRDRGDRADRADRPDRADRGDGTLGEVPRLGGDGLSSAFVDEEQTVMMSAPPSAILTGRGALDAAAPGPIFSDEHADEITELTAREVSEPFDLPSILPNPDSTSGEGRGSRGLTRAAPRGVRPRAIRERVRPDQRGPDQVRVVAAEPTEAKAAGFAESTRTEDLVPGESRSSTLAPTGVSAYLLGGFILGAAAVALILFFVLS